MNKKTNYNKQFFILTFVTFLVMSVLFTSKFYLGDDRLNKTTKLLMVNEIKVELQYAYVSERTLEIALATTNEKLFENYDIQLLIDKNQVEYERFTYTENGVTHYIFYLENTKETLEEMYFVTIHLNDNYKFIVDYRKFENRAYIEYKDDTFFEKQKIEQTIFTLKQTRDEIIKSLKRDDLDEIQREVLTAQLHEIRIELKGYELFYA